jgi:hypothetical protein
MSFYRNTYLKSDHWKNLRLERLVMSKCCCSSCGVKSTNNDVHHITYSTSLWQVKVDDIRVLCRDCHERVHKVMKTYMVDTAKSPNKIWAEVLLILSEENYEKKQDAKDDNQKRAQSEINLLWSPAFNLCVSTASYWSVRLLVFMLKAQQHRECVAKVRAIRILRQQRDDRIKRIQSGKLQRHDMGWIRWALDSKRWDDGHPEKFDMPVVFSETLSFSSDITSL